MFDLQSLCTNQVQPHWISTANTHQLEQTAKSIQYLWSRRNIISYPESNASVDSTESLHCDLNINTYITPSSTENILRFNDLLPPLMCNGEISHLPSHNVSTFAPKHIFNIESIQLHIQFTDRSYDAIQTTLKRSRDHSKYLLIKRKKRRLRELSVNNPNIRQSKRIRNKLHREICDFDNPNTNHYEHHLPHSPMPGSVPIIITDHKHRKNRKKIKIKPTLNVLNLPDLEPATQHTTNPVSDHENSVSSMSISPPRKKRKLNDANANANALTIIDNDVIGDSEESDMGQLESSNSFVYEINLNDLKLDFFLSLFPQLFVTHHLIYCMNSYQHYYYQNYFSAKENKYEWIQTDRQLMDIYHRYVDNHELDCNKYQDFKHRKIVLFFQIRPRFDTKCDEEAMQHHTQLLLRNLMEMNEFIDVDMYEKDDGGDGGTFYMEADTDTDVGDIDPADLLSTNQDILVSNVIKAIHEHNEGHGMNGCGEDGDDEVAGTWDSGVCGFCGKHFSTNKRSEEEWIECEFCGKWYHVICSGLTNQDFLKFQSKKNDKNNKYKCLMCTANN